MEDFDVKKVKELCQETHVVQCTKESVTIYAEMYAHAIVNEDSETVSSMKDLEDTYPDLDTKTAHLLGTMCYNKSHLIISDNYQSYLRGVAETDNADFIKTLRLSRQCKMFLLCTLGIYCATNTMDCFGYQDYNLKLYFNGAKLGDNEKTYEHLRKHFKADLETRDLNNPYFLYGNKSFNSHIENSSLQRIFFGFQQGFTLTKESLDLLKQQKPDIYQALQEQV